MIFTSSIQLLYRFLSLFQLLQRCSQYIRVAYPAGSLHNCKALEDRLDVYTNWIAVVPESCIDSLVGEPISQTCVGDDQPAWCDVISCGTASKDNGRSTDITHTGVLSY